MKLKKILGTLFVALFLLSGIGVLTSSTNQIQMFGKAVFVIIENFDNARNGTELNAHLRGDSASSYEIWGRNNKGSEFFLAGNTQQELFTDEQNYSIGDTITDAASTLVLKKINSPNKIKFNTIDFAASLGSSATAFIVLYVLDSSLIVLRADTMNFDVIDHTVPAVHLYQATLDTDIELKPKKDYYIGLGCPDDYYFIGNKVQSTARPLTSDNNQWSGKSFSPNYPVVGDTISGLSGKLFTYNLRFSNY